MLGDLGQLAALFEGLNKQFGAQRDIKKWRPQNNESESGTLPASISAPQKVAEVVENLKPYCF